MSSAAEPARQPRFSIVVPAYNATPTLAETLDAIAAQTFTDWECVVVDDGSTDDTASMAGGFASRDGRFRVVHKENGGTASAYNTGVSAAAGEYVVICSADDILLPEHLASMSAFIDAEPGFDIYSTNGYFWWPGDRRELFYRPEDYDRPMSLLLRDVIRRCFYGVGATYRRTLHAEVGGYRLGVYGEDFDFWLRAMARGARHRYLPQALSLHRQSPFQKSARLVVVFQWDIRLMNELRRDFDLAPDELRAVDETIRERRKLIRRLQVRRVLRPFKRLAVALLGDARARRLYARMTSRRKQPSN